MIFAGVPSFVGLRLEDGHGPKFLASTVDPEALRGMLQVRALHQSTCSIKHVAQ